MALPTLTKTWQHNVNNSISALGSALADNRRLWRSIKNALIGFGTNPWVVRYSCNSVTAGTAGDGVDRWVSDSDLVWNSNGSANSWIVLRQVGISSTFEMLIALQTSTSLATTAYISVSTVAYTGGTTANRPTSTAETVISNATTISSISSDMATRWSVSQSTDGQCTRIVVAASGVTQFWLLIDKPSNPTTGWGTPFIGFLTVGSPTAAALCASNSPKGAMRNSSTAGTAYMLCEGDTIGVVPANTVFGQINNEISSEWPMIPIAFASGTVGIRGRHGTLQDVWLGSNAVATADTYPGDGSNQFVQFGNIILPWNGGPVNLT